MQHDAMARSALLGLFLLAAPAAAQSPAILGRDDAQFARELHNRGWTDLAQGVVRAFEKLEASNQADPIELLEVQAVGLDIRLDSARRDPDVQTRRQEIAEVIAAKEKLVEEHPRTKVAKDTRDNMPDAYRLLGDYYGRLSVYRGGLGRLRYGARSMKYHNKAQEMDPRNVLTVIGVGTDKMFAPSAFGGDVNQAVALFTKAVEMAPSSPLGHVWLGRAYVKLKKHDVARQHFEKALALEPRSAFARNEYERANREMAAH